MFGNFYGMNQGMIPQMNYQPGTNQYSYNQQNQQKENISWINVNGMQGARDIQIQANQTAWLMDMNQPVFYVKKSDNMGVCTLKAYKFEEINPETPVQAEASNYVTHEELNALKAEIEALKGGQVNESTSRQRKQTESNK